MSEMTELLKELEIGLDQIDKPDTLVALYTRYEEMVSQAEEATEKQDSVYKQTVELLKKDKKLVETCETLRLKVLTEMQKLIDTDNRLAILFVELFQEVKQAAMYERDYMMSKSVVPINKKAKEANEDAEAKRDLAEKLQNLIKLVFDFQGRPSNIEGFPTKESKINGVNPKLSKLPRKEGEEGAVVGIAARNRKLRFSVNGQELPSDTTPTDLAYKYVSDRDKGVMITWATITSAIKESGQQVMSDKKWKVKVNGKVVEGWKVDA